MEQVMGMMSSMSVPVIQLWLGAILAAVILVAIHQVRLGRHLTRRTRDVQQLEAKINHFTEALALLTETSELGFHAMAREIGRVAGTMARVTPLAADGRPLHEVAAAERVSEGEARLRMHMQRSTQAPGVELLGSLKTAVTDGFEQASRARAGAVREASHGALRS
jgi:hypothetical protein